MSDLVHLGLELLRTVGRLRGAEGRQREATATSAAMLYEPHPQSNGSETSAVITYLFAGEALGSLDFLRGDLDERGDEVSFQMPSSYYERFLFFFPTPTVRALGSLRVSSFANPNLPTKSHVRAAACSLATNQLVFCHSIKNGPVKFASPSRESSCRMVIESLS